MGNIFSTPPNATENENLNPDSAIPAPSTTLPSTNHPTYDVFISHAGEDKATIALPLREMLLKHGINAFVDEADIERGADAQQSMIDAMETAKIAVIVLSPEFVARKWPIKELMYFLRRVEESAPGGPDVPVIIPVFYRLTIEELYHEPRLDRRDKDGNRLYEKSRFFERMKNGEPEANISTIETSLRKLQGFMGIRNDFEASNDSAHIAYRRRGVLLQELCDNTRQRVQIKPLTTALNVTGDLFHPYFDTTQDTSDLVFDFSCQDGEISRCTQEARLLKLVLGKSQTENTSIAVRGIGGVGKTSLMRGISCLDAVKQRFKDGVYLMSLGVDGTQRDLINELSKAVEESGGREKAELMRREKKIEKVIQGFRSWFEKRKCLFIVDDVWQTENIPASIICQLLRLHVCGESSKAVVSTRSPDISSSAGTPFCLEPRGSASTESRRILVRYAGIKPWNDDEHRSVNEILERCSGLPLFLAIAGKVVKAMSLRRGHEGCVAYHVYARMLRGNVLTMLTTGVASHARLDTSLIIALDLLGERLQEFTFQVRLGMREMHRRLFVLRKQSKVPITMLKFLWELENEDQAAFIAGEFENVGLADLEFGKREDEPVELLRLHDSLYEFAEMETREHNEERIGHEALLTGYGRGLAMRNGTREWWHTSVEADTYIHANLCRHLLAAGRVAELAALLLSPQWAERQVKVNGISFLDADLLLGVEAIQNGTLIDASDQEGAEIETALRLISEVVALSSRFVGSNIAELHFQLHGRLKGLRKSCKAIEKYVSWIETDGTRPLALCESSLLGEPGGMNTRIISFGVPMLCMAVMNEGDHVACGSRDGRIFVVDAKKWVVEKQWIAHDEWVGAIAVSKDGTRLVSGSSDNTAKVWNVKTVDCVTIFNGHNGWVYDVAVMGDWKRAISVSRDGTAKLWEMETGQLLLKISPAHGAINRVAMLRDEEIAVTGGNDRKLTMWHLRANEQLGDTFDGHENWVSCVAVTPEGKRLLSGSYDCTLRVWDVGSHQQIGDSFEGHTDVVTSVNVSGDGRRIVSGSRDNTIRVWDLESRTEICDPLEGHTDTVSGVSFLGAADRIVSSSWDGTIRAWDVTREKKDKKFANRHFDSVSGVSFTPDGNFVVSASWDSTLRVWNTASGQQVGVPLQGPWRGVNDVAVTPNGQFILFVPWDKTVCVRDFASRQLLHTFTGHTDDVYCVAVTPQSDRAVTGSKDKTVRVWSLTAMDGTHFVLEGQNASVWRVFVSDDGSRVISVDDEDKIFVWDLQTKKLINRFRWEEARYLSRREVLNLVGEATVRDDTELSIPLYGRQIVYGEGTDATVLATMEINIRSWALSPEKKTICLGLRDGQVAFVKLRT